MAQAKKVPGRKKNDGRGRVGGRQKGTPNKVNGLVREIVEESLGGSIPDTILKMLDKKEKDSRGNMVRVLSYSKKIDTLLDLMQYAYPRLKHVEHKGAGAGLLFDLMSMDPKERKKRIKDLQARRKK